MGVLGPNNPIWSKRGRCFDLHRGCRERHSQNVARSHFSKALPTGLEGILPITHAVVLSACASDDKTWQPMFKAATGTRRARSCRDGGQAWVPGHQSRKVPPRPRRRAIRIRGGAPTDGRPAFEFCGEQVLAERWICTHRFSSSGERRVDLFSNIGISANPARGT